jgi:PmbA protein
MLGKDYIFSKLENILKQVNSEQCELVYVFKDDQLTRYANNYIHQNVAERNGTLTVRIINGKKLAYASINSLEEDKVKHTINNLYESIKFSPEDPDFVSLPSVKEYSNLSSFDEETAFYSPEKRAEMVKIITQEAEKYNAISSGQCNTSMTETAVFNSLGVKAYNKMSKAFLLSAVMKDGEGFAEHLAPRISDINAHEIAQKSVERCIKSANPIEVKPDNYTVVLESFGVAQLMEIFASENFGAYEVMEERSCVSGKLGEKITGENISLYQDPLNENGFITPFDLEGQPSKKIPLVENGIAKSILHTSYTANMMKSESTGSKLSTFSHKPYPQLVSMDAGNNTVEEMIESTEYGLYIARLNYLGLVEPRHTLTTGLTRGGTFLVKDGKIVAPVYNLRFTDSLLKIFSNVTMISKDRRYGGEMYTSVLAPAIKTERFKFTGSARTGV